MRHDGRSGEGRGHTGSTWKSTRGLTDVLTKPPPVDCVCISIKKKKRKKKKKDTSDKRKKRKEEIGYCSSGGCRTLAVLVVRGLLYCFVHYSIVYFCCEHLSSPLPSSPSLLLSPLLSTRLSLSPSPSVYLHSDSQVPQAHCLGPME